MEREWRTCDETRSTITKTRLGTNPVPKSYKIERMNRKALWIKITRSTLAFALLFNFTLPALCASLCAANLSCPAGAVGEAKAVRSCCDSESSLPGKSVREQKPQAHCCAWIGKTTPPDATIGSQHLASQPAPVLPAIVPESLDLPTQILQAQAAAILFHSDSSPPNVFYHPDLGRAPPSF